MGIIYDGYYIYIYTVHPCWFNTTFIPYNLTMTDVLQTLPPDVAKND